MAIENGGNAIQGRALSPGRARGPALQFDEDPHELEPQQHPDDRDREAALTRLERALERTRSQLNEIVDHGSKRFEDVIELVFQAHLLMLEDDAFSGDIRRAVEQGAVPERAVTDTIDRLSRSFTSSNHDRTAEKSEDVRDLGYRLLANLPDDPPKRAFVAGRIVILAHVFPSELLRLAIDGAAGVVLVDIALTAHLSILAHSLGIPVIATTNEAARTISDETPLLIDAIHGTLELDENGQAAGDRTPPDEVPRDTTEEEHSDSENRFPAGPRLLASVNILADAYAAAGRAAGIGLYRSEFPFIIRGGLIDEEAQTRIYRHIVHSFPDSEVTLRTADIGGDKILQGEAVEDNPFLGIRGIRFSLANPEMFRGQLRAMLRAGEGANLRIMLPMVSTVEDVLEARKELDRCLEELASGSEAYNDTPKLGAMIEIPSAAASADEIAEVTDFLSIGMNDLVMYMLAVDRTNARLAALYRTHHPVIARAVARILHGGLKADVPVSICGEAAADPLLLPFYCGIGADSVSVSPEKLDEVARWLRVIDRDWAREVASRMTGIARMAEMERLLDEVASKLGIAREKVNR